MKNYIYELLTEKEIEKLCSRENLDISNILELVKKIEKEVLDKGDIALTELTEKFDGVLLSNLKVSEKEFKEAGKLVDKKLKQSIKIAKSNIYKFHKIQFKRQTKEIGNKIETSKGVFCWSEFRAIENVGFYIPGGTAPLFSTILMLGIPAKIAGCKNISICTPPNKEGKIHPSILWTAQFLGIKKIYKIGGAQGIFALTHGTETIKKIDKIFGPGNQYVMVAKTLASQKVAIDMPAGPSEVLVVIDNNSNTKFVASDLLSQAEHGNDSQVVLVSSSKNKIEEINKEIILQLNKLKRSDIAKKSLEKSFSIFCKNEKECIDFVNKYAPEHLIISVDNWKKIIKKINNTGSVFCGKFSSESFGDYASGTNHVLPTSGFTKSHSGISVKDFGKFITFQEIKKRGLNLLGDHVINMAQNELLDAHANSVIIRKNYV